MILFIATATCVAYACHLAGLVSLGTIVGAIELVFFGALAVVGLVAAFKYRARRREDWA
jgi:hypothetical protein